MNQLLAGSCIAILATFVVGCSELHQGEGEPFGGYSVELANVDGGLTPVDGSTGPRPPLQYSRATRVASITVDVCPTSSSSSSATCVAVGRTVTSRVWGGGAGGSGGDSAPNYKGGDGGQGGGAGAYVTRSFVVPANALYFRAYAGSGGAGGLISSTTGSPGIGGAESGFNYVNSAGYVVALLRASGGKAAPSLANSAFWTAGFPLTLPATTPTQISGAAGAIGSTGLMCSGGGGGSAGSASLGYGAGGAGGHGGYRRHLFNCMASGQNGGRTVGSRGDDGRAEIIWN